MAWYPGAVKKEITKHRTPLTVYNRVNLHVAVSEAESLFGFFSNPKTFVVSHFYVRKNGVVEQYVDTKYRAVADLQGNDATISIETQGGVNNAQGEPWTEEQVKSLAAIYKWARETHGIKNARAVDSRPGDSSKGLSYHRLGVDPWRVSGGMKYSNSRGKICPGDAKIAQIPRIFDLSQAGVQPGGGGSVAPEPTPTPAAPGPRPSGLEVDGFWGSGTTRRLQEILGTPVDGVVSSQAGYWGARNPGLTTGWDWVTKAKGSLVIAALQRRIGVKDDGMIGPDTIKALQRHLGTPVDGVLSPKSQAIIELQKRLNAGTV